MKIAGVVLAFAASLAVGQRPASPASEPTGEVSGRVICGDTDQPGRFATVQLVSEKPPEGSFAARFDSPTGGMPGNDSDMQRPFSVIISRVMTGSGMSALTDIDGNFRMQNVPAGTYYVIAQLAGYESALGQLSVMERMKASPATLKEVEAVA